jgi:hypothetical protein
MWSMVADPPVAGPAVDRAEISRGSVRLRTPTRGINKIQNQMCHSSSKEKPTRAGGHRAGFSTGVMLSRAWA